jgi:uncharacterized membrane protein
MFHKIVGSTLTSALLSLTLVTPLLGQQPEQTVTAMKQTAQKAMEQDKQVVVFLKTQKDGKNKLTGKVSQISEEGLTLTDPKSAGPAQLAFDEIKEIRSKSSHTGLIIAAIAIGAAVVILAATLSKLTSD